MSFFIRKRRGGSSSSLPTNLTSRTSDLSSSSSKNQINGVKNRFQQQQQRGVKRRRGSFVREGQRGQETSKKKHDDDEITSESEAEDDDGEGVVEDEEAVDSSSETEQEARVRIAKEQISALRRKLAERGEEVDDRDVAGLIKESELVEEGKVVRKVVTVEFQGKELVTTRLLYGKIVKSPLTCIRTTATHVYACTKSGTLVCVSITTPTLKTHKKLSPPPVTSLAVSTTTVAASTPSAIHLLTPETLEITHTFRTALNTVSLSISETTLFSTHKDRTVKLWNLQERAYVESLFGHQDIPTCVDALNDNRIVTSGGFDRSLRVWKIDEESQLVYNWDEDIIDVVAVINAGFFVAGSCSGSIGLFSFGRKKPLHVVPRAHGVVNGVGRWVTSLFGVGDFVASGSDDGVVKVWKVCSRKLEFVRDVVVGVGVVAGIGVIADDEGDVKIVVGVGTESVRGRFGGRYCTCSRVLLIH